MRTLAFVVLTLLLSAFGCVRYSPMYVVDDAALLTEAQIEQLNARSVLHEERTSNQIAIWTTTDDHGDILKASMDFANQLGVGQADKDNGVLIGVCVACRTAAISTGLGTQRVLHDATADHFLNTVMFPHFKKGEIFEGLLAVQDSIAQYLEQPGREIEGE